MPQNGRSKEDLISKIYQVDTIYWILQCLSYYVRIKFSRHQHDTVIEPKTEWGGSRQQLFRHYCDSSGWRNNRQHRKSLLRNQIIIKNKNALCLSVNAFSTKTNWGHHILRLQLETGPPFYVVIRTTRRSSLLQCKGNTFISQLLWDPEYWPGPGNRTCDLPLCSFTRSTELLDWANNVAVQYPLTLF